MIAAITDFSKVLDDLAKVSGLQFIWHFTNAEWNRKVTGVQNSHNCNFCCKIKRENSGEMLKKCIYEHHVDEFFKSLKLRSPFIIHCHAGAMELIIPLILRSEFCGVLCVGTFRSPGKYGYNEYRKERMGLPEITENRLLQWGDFLGKLMQHYLEDRKLSDDTSQLISQTVTQDVRILRAVKFIRKHYRQKITAGETAMIANISKTRFTHIFTRETGYSFSDFLQRVRIGEARNLVEGSNMALGEIAESCGISDQSRMGVLFRRYFNTTPLKMRQYYREKILEAPPDSEKL